LFFDDFIPVLLIFLKGFDVEFDPVTSQSYESFIMDELSILYYQQKLNESGEVISFKLVLLDFLEPDDPSSLL
jgi:hypothetical protein